MASAATRKRPLTAPYEPTSRRCCNAFMDDAKPSLARRALAAAVLVVIAIVAVRLIVGVLSAIFWLLAIVVLVVAGLWAWATLRSSGRKRAEKRPRRAEP